MLAIVFTVIVLALVAAVISLFVLCTIVEDDLNQKSREEIHTTVKASNFAKSSSTASINVADTQDQTQSMGRCAKE